jgi:ubiquinone/menaquinone biosynthesis C-methylase UbiE
VIWVLAGIALVLLAAFAYWQLVIAEGAYLGQWVVTLLYDRAAPKYDDIKAYNPPDEFFFLAIPLSQALGPEFKGIILDVAAGTGRVAEAMAQLPEFQGLVVGLDHSARMLLEAKKKLPGLPLIQADALQLPFADQALPAVASLESLEFLPSPRDGLAEMARVLAPGGMLLTTNRLGWEGKLLPGKVLREAELKRILASLPLTDITFRIWESNAPFDMGVERDAALEAYVEAHMTRPFHKRIVLEFTTSRYQKIWARKQTKS